MCLISDLVRVLDPLGVWIQKSCEIWNLELCWVDLVFWVCALSLSSVIELHSTRYLSLSYVSFSSSSKFLPVCVLLCSLLSTLYSSPFPPPPHFSIYSHLCCGLNPYHVSLGAQPIFLKIPLCSIHLQLNWVCLLSSDLSSSRLNFKFLEANQVGLLSRVQHSFLKISFFSRHLQLNWVCPLFLRSVLQSAQFQVLGVKLRWVLVLGFL